MSEKVKITRKQADCLEKTRLIYGDIGIVGLKMGHGDDYGHIRDIDADTLIRALYIGYEIEETPEDQVRALHEKAAKEEEIANFKKDRATAQFWSGYGIGVVDTVKALKLEIEDVNI